MKMKSRFLVILLLYCSFCTAQQVVSSGGFSIRSELNVNWIIGGSLSDISASDLNMNKPQYGIVTETRIAVKIYPVPAKDYLNIEITPVDTGRIILELYDSAGAKMLRNSVANQNRLQIDIRNLRGGIYILKVFLPGTELPFKTEKIIKI
jgi:hypothetical protein